MKIGENDFITVPREKVESIPYALPMQTSGKRTLLVQAYDKASNVTTASEEFVITPIAPPIITEYPRQLDNGQPLIVKGTSYPDGEILLSVQEDNKEIKSQKTQVDAAGRWSVLYGEKLTSGIYKIFAQAIDKRGAMSKPTPIYYVSVGQATFIQICGSVIQLLGVIIPIITLLALLAFLLWQSLRKLRSLKKRIAKEVREAEGVIHKAFDHLKDNVRAHIKLLEKTKTKRELTAEEEKMLINIKRTLDEAEEIIDKEISDIEKKVN